MPTTYYTPVDWMFCGGPGAGGVGAALHCTRCHPATSPDGCAAFDLACVSPRTLCIGGSIGDHDCCYTDGHYENPLDRGCMRVAASHVVFGTFGVPTYPWVRCGYVTGEFLNIPHFEDPCCCFDCNSDINAADRCETICPTCTPGDTFDLASGLCQHGSGPGACPPGTHFDPICGKCVSDTPPKKCYVWNTTLCQWVPDPGKCWCEATGTCVDCPDPPCKSQLNCAWDFAACEWVCDRPDCDYNQTYNYTFCQCVDCPVGQCNCANECIDCPKPPCYLELDCAWDTAFCQWVCNEPSCPPDLYWDEDLCQCDDCTPSGKCPCDLTRRCIECPVNCKDALHCVWNKATCKYDCDKPVCPAGQVWSWVNCACGDGDGVDIVVSRVTGFVFVTWRQGSAVKVARSEDRGLTFLPPVTVATDAGGDAAPALALDRWDTLWLFYHDTTDRTWGYRSNNQGRAGSWVRWVDGGANFKWPRPVIEGNWVLVFGFVFDQLTLHYDNQDWGQFGITPTGIILGDPPLYGDPPHQRVGATVDRHGTTWLLYADAYGRVVRRYSNDPLNIDRWSASEALWPFGDYPVIAEGVTHLVGLWVDEILRAFLGIETLAFLKGRPDLPLERIFNGLAGDERDDFWFAGREKDAPHRILVFHTGNLGKTWDLVPGCPLAP